MSEKIKSKDLSYDSTLPPFLRRLHEKNAGRGDADRHERPAARPKKSKDPNDDDEPTVIDENGETLSKDVVERLTNPGETGFQDTKNVKGDLAPATEPTAAGALPDPKTTNGVTTNRTAIRKRKVAKVIGQGKSAEEGQAQYEVGEEKPASKPTKKAKKKLRPPKMNFDDDEAET